MQCIMSPLIGACVMLTSLARLQKEDVHSENERPLLIGRIAVIQSIHSNNQPGL